MAKYSYEFKKKVVECYLSGEGGLNHLAKMYGVSNHSVVRTWIRTHSKYGYDGLMKKKNKKYSLEFKVNIVELYLSKGYSTSELGDKFGIMNRGTITKWVQEYEKYGPIAFIPKKRGRKPDMKKRQSNLKVKDKSDYIKQLEEELKKAKLENKLLKQLRGLRLAEEKQKKKQE